MGNKWVRWGVLVGSALSMTGCLELALIEIMDDREDDEYDCGDYECGETYDESGDYWDESYDTESYADEEMVEPEYDPYYSEQAIDITDSALAGDMGSVRGFDDEDPMHNGWAYEGWATVEIHALGQNGSDAAMTIFEIDGGIDHPSLRPGAHFEFSWDAYNYDNQLDRPLRMDVVGCSGPSEGDWVFDEMANEVEVDVSEGSTPGTVVIDFTATFSAYGPDDPDRQTVVGSFETTSATHAQ
ncbi:MAG: hypothetical protein HYY06_20210 [Deltaproteobacteria bacterium]|nr:hypothetical protein [Deltaproteobacteria bacterium]